MCYLYLWSIHACSARLVALHYAVIVRVWRVSVQLRRSSRASRALRFIVHVVLLFSFYVLFFPFLLRTTRDGCYRPQVPEGMPVPEAGSRLTRKSHTYPGMTTVIDTRTSIKITNAIASTHTAVLMLQRPQVPEGMPVPEGVVATHP